MIGRVGLSTIKSNYCKYMCRSVSRTCRCISQYSKNFLLKSLFFAKKADISLQVVARCSLSVTTRYYQPLPTDIDSRVDVLSFDASVSKSPASVVEVEIHNGDIMLKVNQTCFRSTAQVSIPPVPEKEEWQVGYIQGVKNVVSEDEYGKAGTVKTIVPELESGDYPMVNDSDGKFYPFCKESGSTETIKGPKAEHTLSLELYDIPNSMSETNSYDVLYKYKSTSQKICSALGLHSVFGKNSKILPPVIENKPLTRMTKNSEFCTWLVIRCANTGDFHVLKTVEWRVNLSIAYDIGKPVGERVRYRNNNGIQKAPTIHKDNHIDIPQCVLGSPSVNDAYFVMWSPLNMELPQILLKPPNCRPDFKIP